MFNIRAFQIIVPLVIGIYLIWQFYRIYQRKAYWKDIWPIVLLSVSIGILALFPDTIAGKIAQLLDIKSNVNVIFGGVLSILALSILRLFNLYRKQQNIITKLITELSVLNSEKNNNLP